MDAGGCRPHPVRERGGLGVRSVGTGSAVCPCRGAAGLCAPPGDPTSWAAFFFCGTKRTAPGVGKRGLKLKLRMQGSRPATSEITWGVRAWFRVGWASPPDGLEDMSGACPTDRYGALQ